MNNPNVLKLPKINNSQVTKPEYALRNPSSSTKEYDSLNYFASQNNDQLQYFIEFNSNMNPASYSHESISNNNSKSNIDLLSQKSSIQYQSNTRPQHENLTPSSFIALANNPLTQTSDDLKTSRHPSKMISNMPNSLPTSLSLSVNKHRFNINAQNLEKPSNRPNPKFIRETPRIEAPLSQNSILSFNSELSPKGITIMNKELKLERSNKLPEFDGAQFRDYNFQTSRKVDMKLHFDNIYSNSSTGSPTNINNNDDIIFHISSLSNNNGYLNIDNKNSKPNITQSDKKLYITEPFSIQKTHRRLTYFRADDDKTKAMIAKDKRLSVNTDNSGIHVDPLSANNNTKEHTIAPVDKPYDLIRADAQFDSLQKYLMLCNQDIIEKDIIKQKQKYSNGKANDFATTIISIPPKEGNKQNSRTNKSLYRHRKMFSLKDLKNSTYDNDMETMHNHKLMNKIIESNIKRDYRLDLQTHSHASNSKSKGNIGASQGIITNSSNVSQDFQGIFSQRFKVIESMKGLSKEPRRIDKQIRYMSPKEKVHTKQDEVIHKRNKVVTMNTEENENFKNLTDITKILEEKITSQNEQITLLIEKFTNEFNIPTQSTISPQLIQ